MPSFHLEVPHNLGREAATERLKGFMDKLRENQEQIKNLEEKWDDNLLTFSFRTYGFNISGTLRAEEESVVMDGTLPFAAVAFRGKIEQAIREKLERALQ